MTTTSEGARRTLVASARGALTSARSSSLARGGLLLLITNTALNASNFVFHIATTRLLGPDQYGELGALLNLVVVLTLPLAAVEAAVAQMVATHVGRGERVSLRSTARWWLPVSLGSMVLFAALSPLIASALHSSVFAALLLVAWLGPSMFATVLQGALIGEGRIGAVAVTLLSGGAAKLVLGIALAAAGFGATGAFLGTVMSGIVMCGVLWVLVGPQLVSRADGPRVDVSDVLRSASAIGGLTLLISLDTLMARHFLSPGKAGIYAAASTLGKIPMFLPGAAYIAVFPRLAAQRGRGGQARRQLLGALAAVFALAAFGALVLMVLPGQAIHLVAGAQYRTASGPLRLLAPADGAAAVSGMLIYYLMARRTRLSLAGWAGSVLAVILVIAMHGTPEQIAVDMLVANLVMLGSVAVGSILLTLGDIRREAGHEAEAEATAEVVAEAEPAVAGPDWTSWLGRGRKLVIGAACAGIVAIIPLGFTTDLGVTGVFGDLAVGLLVLAVITGLIHTGLRVRLPVAVTASTQMPTRFSGRRSSSKWWALFICVVALVAAFSWFDPGTVFAGGDDAPPNGLAWISHMFDAWAWSGSNLGGPNQYQLFLPWAVVLEVVHFLGGSAGMAQQTWYTALFAGAGVGGFGFLRLLRLAPPAACVGALAYMFNPYTLSFVNNSPVYLAAMAAFTAVGCCVVAVGSGRIRIRVGVFLLACLSPLLGYVYTNPPTLMLIACGAILAGVGAAAVCGSDAVRRLWRFALVGLPVLLLVSAYWLVPALIEARVAASGHLSATSSWVWTETRATLANALWLNTQWSWKYAYYYPFAPGYSHLPLLLLKFLPAMLAFGAIPLTFARSRAGHGLRNLALTFAATALFLIVLSNGTRAPGSVLFSLLYSLPDGWLLREPSRFLLGAALAYSVLIAVTVQAAGEMLRPRLGPAPAMRSLRALGSLGGRQRGGPGRQPVSFEPQRPELWRSLRWPGAVTLITVLAILVPGYPLIFGQTVPDKRPHSNLPGQHVKVPAYWSRMAGYLNNELGPGSLLMMPPDPFYQIPYSWGYFGSDSFPSNMIARPVIDPSPQGYFQVSAQLLTATNRFARDLLVKRWEAASRIAGAMDVDYVLVRNDIKARGFHPPIIVARFLSRALAHDPDARLVHRSGKLQLFRIDRPSTTTEVVTDTSSTPNLEALMAFPAGTAIIKSKPRADLPAIIETPPVTKWTNSGPWLHTTVKLPRGRRYKFEVVHDWVKTAHKASTAPAPKLSVTYAGDEAHLRMSTGPTLIHNGDFSNGAWERHAQFCGGSPTDRTVRGLVVRGAGPDGSAAFRLLARRALACEYAPVRLTHGPLLVSLSVKHVTGGPAQLCLWYAPRDRCSGAHITLPSRKKGWHHYLFTMGAPGKATGLRLILYSQPTTTGKTTINEFADVSVNAADFRWSPILVSPPTAKHPSKVHLIQTPDTASDQWHGPAGDQRVVVDGLRNGWLGAGSASNVYYGPATSIRWAYGATLFGIAIALLLLVWVLWGTTSVPGRPPSTHHVGPPEE